MSGATSREQTVGAAQAGANLVAMGDRLVPDERFPETAASGDRSLDAGRDEIRFRGGDAEPRPGADLPASRRG